MSNIDHGVMGSPNKNSNYRRQIFRENNDSSDEAKKKAQKRAYLSQQTARENNQGNRIS